MGNVCGSPRKSDGEPCQYSPAEKCPHHGDNAVGNPGAGRPTDYRPEYCERVIDMGRQGKSRANMASALDVTMKTLLSWEDKHPEFLHATTRARELARSWWEDQGQQGVWAGSDFNATAYRLQVMNRFPSAWRDRRSVEHSGEVDTGGDVNIYLPSNDRDKLPEELRKREAALNGGGE